MNELIVALAIGEIKPSRQALQRFFETLSLTKQTGADSAVRCELSRSLLRRQRDGGSTSIREQQPADRDSDDGEAHSDHECETPMSSRRAFTAWKTS